MSVRVLAVVGLAATLVACATPQDLIAVDVLITGGEAHLGDGALGRVSDVGLLGDRIVFVGDAERAGIEAARRIDATGLIVAPGFIDPHTHALEDLQSEDPERRRLAHYLAQGVTTLMVGNDGSGPLDIAGAAAGLESAGVGVNVAFHVGFGPVRRAVLGEEARAPNTDELDTMRAHVARAMCDGAVGFSTGLFYAPQSYAGTPEVVAIAREAALHGGIYDTHLRDESSYTVGLLAAVEEAIAIGRNAGLPVHIAHIKALGVDVWGESADVIALVEAARKNGVRVTADQYPWPASGTHLGNALVPRWVMADSKEAMRARLADAALADQIREEMTENLRRRGGPAAILFTAAREALRGWTLEDIAAARGVTSVEAAIAIVTEGDARIASFNMHEDDIAAFMTRPWLVTSSDGTRGHPRRFASFSRKYARYVSETGLLTTADFIHHSTGATADILGLEDRGRLRVGAFADIVVFDPHRFRPRADFTAPERLSEGVVHLFVNGVQIIADGQQGGALEGRFLPRRQFDSEDCPP